MKSNFESKEMNGESSEALQEQNVDNICPNQTKIIESNEPSEESPLDYGSEDEFADQNIIIEELYVDEWADYSQSLESSVVLDNSEALLIDDFEESFDFRFERAAQEHR